MIGTFLNTKKEQRAWHRGAYKGLKYFRPSKLLDNLELNKYDSFRDWEDSEGQYTDPLAISVYTVKMTGITTGSLAYLTGAVCA